jgi:CheY-like chemotaxis protein
MTIDASRTQQTHPATAVLITDREDVHEAVVDALTPGGYVVLRAREAGEALEWVRDIDTDVILVDHGTDGLGLAMVRDLHEHPDLRQWIPILLLCDEEISRDFRVEAMAAGAWDALTMPLDAETTRLWLARMIAGKREADGVLEEAWINTATGLYSWEGLADSAEVLVAHTARYNRPVACVACGPDAGAWDAATVRRLADVGRRTIRASDILGVASQGAELLVLAPDTGEEGARLLALRLRDALMELGGAGTIRTGYFAVDDAAALDGEPTDILVRAGRALRTAQASAAAEPVRWNAEPAGEDRPTATPR